MLIWWVKYVKNWKLNQINISLWDIKKILDIVFTMLLSKKGCLKTCYLLREKIYSWKEQSEENRIWRSSRTKIQIELELEAITLDAQLKVQETQQLYVRIW
jgi:hypothetical protein